MPYEPYNSRSENFYLIAPRWQILLSAALFVFGCLALYLAAIRIVDRELISSGVVILTTGLSLFSSLRSGPDGVLDERERGIRNYAIAGGASCVVIGFAVYMLFASAFEALWVPSAGFQFGALGQFMLSATLQIAIFLAARETPPYAADLDEDD